MNLSELYKEIETNHHYELCKDASEIDALNASLEYSLPQDMIAFYKRYSTVKLFVNADDVPYRFVPISEIRRTRIDIYEKDSDELGPASWLTICDVHDGNYISIDIASRDGDECNYIDCFHETFAAPGQSMIIAKSLAELLERALYGSDNQLYYLQNNFSGYGDAREDN